MANHSWHSGIRGMRDASAMDSGNEGENYYPAPNFNGPWCTKGLSSLGAAPVPLH